MEGHQACTGQIQTPAHHTAPLACSIVRFLKGPLKPLASITNGCIGSPSDQPFTATIREEDFELHVVLRAGLEADAGSGELIHVI